MNEMLKGVYPVLITPFRDSGAKEIDIEGMKKNIDWYIESGVPGLCILGSTGEFVSLTQKERFLVTEECLKHIDGRIKCIVGTASETTNEVIEYSKFAEEKGADAVMIINPYYSMPTEEEVVNHYYMVADAIQIPIMIYNNPPHTGRNMDANLLGKIFEKENIQYIKDACGDLSKIASLQRRCSKRINVFCGNEDMVFENFVLGATGWISVCGNIFPKECQSIFNYFESGDVEKAKELFEKMYPLLNNLENGSKPVQKVKYALSKMGKTREFVRLPRLELTDEEKSEFDAMLGMMI